MTHLLIRDAAYNHLTAYRRQACTARQIRNATLNYPRRIGRDAVFVALNFASSAYSLGKLFKV